MRFFYVKDGKIVGHEGITSRMPGSALVLPISASDLEGLTRFVGGSNMGLHSLTQRGAIHQELRPTVPR
ncbi:MAG: hypothetical protein OJF52_003717 [Nitrospira sp.]|nr:MAG: hypothetical protein OJF52_003717 [Nitrospira sp.]